MRIPLSWLAEYVELPDSATAHTVAADLVRVGLEEESIITGEITGPVVVGRVVTKEPEQQKNGKTINWCSLDVGRGEDDPQYIVCGAHNFEAGDRVVVAMPGAVLPGGFAISPRKTYGHVSEGMICSTEELGLGADPTGGIIVLGAECPDAAPGDDCLQLLGLTGRDSECVEINVTPDRGYCFSIRGVAREYAHGSGRAVSEVFNDPHARDVDSPSAPGIPVALDEVDPSVSVPGCQRLIARGVSGIAPHAQSPGWMKRRLTLAGMRPLSLIVDVTNYVMLALGQPLHAYDADVIDTEHGLTVRRARSGESLTTLDGADRDLHPQDLLICDGKDGSRPLGLAGVMGGQVGEVSDTTTHVIIESAWFDPITIARTARRHKLPSEASKRFERGVDTAIQATAAQMACELLAEFGGGRVESAFTEAGAPVPGVAFDIDPEAPGRITGASYERDRVIEVLREVGCTVEDRGETLTVITPTWRPDLQCVEDLTEEIARVDGYEMIPSELPAAIAGGGMSHADRVRRRIGDFLAARGLHEVLTYPFTSAQRLDAFGVGEDDERRRAVKLANPLSEEAPLLRTELLQTLVDAVVRNTGRHAENVALFEMGRVTAPQPKTAYRSEIARVDSRPSEHEIAAVTAGVPQQPVHVAGVLTGERSRGGWYGPGREADYGDAIECAVATAGMLGVTLEVEAAEYAPFHPGRCASLSCGDAHVGYAGELHPKVIEELGLPTRAVAFEINVDALAEASDVRRESSTLAHHAVVKEDIALIVSSDVTVGQLTQALHDGGGDLLESVRPFDIYTGEQVGDGKKSVAFALRMRAGNRTLNAEESAKIRGAAVAVAQQRFEAVLRDS